MPTYKHPCPYCGKFIDSVVAACPFCGQVDPFAPKRCQNCRKIVDDPAWIVCPSCGASLMRRRRSHGARRHAPPGAPAPAAAGVRPLRAQRPAPGTAGHRPAAAPAGRLPTAAA